VGRTGSFTLIDCILDYLEESKEADPQFNPFNVLRDIRRYRPSSVQTPVRGKGSKKSCVGEGELVFVWKHACVVFGVVVVVVD